MPTLPSGTVTFLFTDIQSSTMLWGRSPDVMAAALRRHDAIMREAIERNGGTVFKTVGDAFYAAFGRPSDAVNAAVQAQAALAAEPWPPDCPIAVRMALHTGVCELRDGDYFGPPLNRVARLLSAGHGGQVLFSQATQQLIQDRLPEGAAIRDLKDHCLKDLLLPEHIFQLMLPGLNNDFPPLKTLASQPNNLPIQPTPFIGRQREVEEVCDLLRGPQLRLLTLAGPGGTGKTRLALQAAADVLDHFTDGVFLIPLAGIDDADEVPARVAQTLNVKEVAGQTVEAAVLEHLHDKDVLIIVDNFEQVIDAADFVSEILRSCPKPRLMVTSRVTLRISGERQYHVPTLALPEPDAPLTPAALGRYDAIALFVERAQSVRPDLRLDDDNAGHIAEICRRLDGLPLAIELAAARTKLFPPAALLARLDHRLKVLTGGARDLPARQQTLRGAIDWSYSLLDPAERTLFTRLSVFAGGFSLETAEAVCDGDDLDPAARLEIDLTDGVASLLEKSLIREIPVKEGEPRFGMLQSIREYALEALTAAGEAETFQRRHARHFHTLAEAAVPGLRSPRPEPWLDGLDAEYDNLRGALEWAEERDPNLLLGLGACLWRFWFARSRLSEGRSWLGAALAAGGTDPAHRAEALRGAGDLAQTQGDYAEGTRLLEQSVALYRQSPDRHGLAGALYSLAWVAADQGDFGRAAAIHTESLTISRELNDRWGIASALDSLAWAALYQGDCVKATELHRESLALAREIGDRWTESNALAGLGWAATLEGRYDDALSLQSQSLTLRRTHGSKLVIAYGLEGMAALAAVEGQGERACRLWGAAESLRQAIGAPLAPFDLALYRGLLPAEEDRDLAAWAAGRAMPLDQAIAYALEEASSVQAAALSG